MASQAPTPTPTPTPNQSSVLQPHSEDAEMALLGSLLQDPQYLPHVAFLQPSHFYIIKHGWIYDAIRECGLAADLITVGAELAKRNLLAEAGGEGYLARLTDTDATSLHSVRYARVVEEYAIRRSYIQAATEIARLACDQTKAVGDIVSGGLRVLDSAHKPHTLNASRSARDVFEELWTVVEARHADPTAAAGVPSGYTDLDKLLGGGFHNGELIIVAARPAMGKTSLLNGFAANATGASNFYHPMRRYLTAYYSMEMNAQELAVRFAAMDSGIDSQRLRAGALKDEEWAGLTQTIKGHAGIPLSVNDYPQSVDSLIEDAERIRYHGGLDLVIADYLGLFQERGDAYERVSRIARDLKNAAKRLNVPVICAAQLSRSCESRENKRPVMSDLRDSGEIEQAADVVIFIYRDEYYDPNTEYKNIAEIIVGKNRNGPTGAATLFFDKRLTRFGPLTRERIQLA